MKFDIFQGQSRFDHFRWLQGQANRWFRLPVWASGFLLVFSRE